MAYRTDLHDLIFGTGTVFYQPMISWRLDSFSRKSFFEAQRL